MRDITLEELLEAGCHFGHQVTRQNPKARDFVFEARDNIHIIDLAKTKEGLDEALSYIRDLAAKGSILLVVGTKRQAKTVVDEEVKRVLSEVGENDKNESKLFYITNRWVGGILTNFAEVGKNYKKLKELGEKVHDPEVKAKFTKKEIGLWEKERQKLEGFYQGVADIPRMPDALFIVDTHQEDLAVREAQKTGVKTVGIVDTNADPFVIDHPIPANDDAVGSIKLIVSGVMDAWIEGVKENQKSIPIKSESKTKDQKQEEKTEKKEVKTEVKEKPAKKQAAKAEKPKKEVKKAASKKPKKEAPELKEEKK